MNDSHYDYDLLVIGTGPGGEGAAMQAAKGGMRVAVAEGVDCHAGMEIEVRSAVLREQSHALAPLKSEVGPGIRTVQRRHLRTPFMGSFRDCCKSPTKTKNALQFAARVELSICLCALRKSTPGDKCLI